MEEMKNQSTQNQNQQTTTNFNELSGYEKPFKSKDVDYSNPNKIEEILSEQDKKIIEEFAQEIGIPACSYQEFTDLFVNAARTQGDASIRDYLASKGPQFTAFFERYMSNYNSVYPSTELSDIFNKNKNDLINSFNYGGKEVFNSPLSLKASTGASNSVILAKFLSGLDGGNTVSIPLWHSGFRVVINPPTVSELTTLHLNVVKSEIDLGRETMSFSCAANRSYSVDTIKEFIRGKIYSTTLDIDHNTTDIFQYISILDFDFLILGLLSATYVNKITTVRTCVNTYRGSNGKELGCGHIVAADLDPNKLAIVDRTLLTNNMVQTISKRTPGSVSLTEMINYKTELDKILDTKRERAVEFKRNNSVIKFKIPDVNSYIQDSALWVEEAMNDIQNLSMEMSDNEKRRLAEKIKDIRSGTLLFPNVDSIGIANDDGEVSLSTERLTVYQGLKYITNSIDILNDYFESISKYLNRSAIAICATPNYVCPKCQKLQENIKQPPVDFDAFIPLNMLDFFLTLVEVKIAMTQIHTKGIL